MVTVQIYQEVPRRTTKNGWKNQATLNPRGDKPIFAMQMNAVVLEDIIEEIASRGYRGRFRASIVLGGRKGWESLVFWDGRRRGKWVEVR